MAETNIPLFRKPNFLFLFLSLFLWFQFPAELHAALVSSNTASTAALGWLRLGTAPLESLSDHSVASVDSFAGDDGTLLFHVANLSPEGFVILAADDRVEPVIAFSGQGSFNSDKKESPLSALLFQDLADRLQSLQSYPTEGSVDQGTVSALSDTSDSAAESALENSEKWTLFQTIGSLATAPSFKETSVSNERVAPIISSAWGQSTYNGSNLYNYYTPNNWYSGCVATAMGQVMYFHQHPTTGVGTGSFSITVDTTSETHNLRGGDGSGGAYLWASMPAVPTTSITDTQRQAIGNLIHDAGLSVNMTYTSTVSSTDTLKSALAFKNTFGYTNAVRGYNSANDLGSALTEMINPNLDAGLPVILGISTLDNSNGHAVVCDGYGYNNSNLFHHLNMGWSGSQDAWYDLPTIDTSTTTYEKVYKCVYNIFKSQTGEIISGRVLDLSGLPVTGATVTATKSGGGQYETTTNSKGIFALSGLPSSSTYSIAAAKSGLTFSAQSVSTGQSSDLAASSGNRWAVDFQASSSTFPTISSATMATDNSYIDITFSEAVYNSASATGALDASDLTLTFLANGGTATALTKGALTKTTGGALAGGESSVRLALTVTGTPSGHETVEIKPSGSTAIYDAEANAMATTETTGPINLYGTAGPVVTSVSSSTENGYYKAAAAIAVTVTFSESVIVTGEPRLLLETGTTDRYATYASGSGTATLAFNYTVQTGDTSSDLNYQSTGSLELNSGTIKNSGGLSAILTLPATASASSLAGQKAIVIDTTAPSVLSVSSSSSDGTYGPGQVVNVTVTFSENVNVATQETGPSILLQVISGGREATYTSGGGTSYLSFSYTVVSGDYSSDLDYVDINALVTNGSEVTDLAGNAATLTLASPGAAFSLGSNKNIRIDGQAATVTSLACSNPDGSYRAGEILTLSVNFSENVNVTGSPKLSLAAAPSDPGSATYASGTGTTGLNFTYTVRAGDSTADLDAASITALTLNSGTINDTSGNPANLTLPSAGTPGSLSASRQIRLDTAAPLFQSASLESGNAWALITFNEAVYGDLDAGTPLTIEDFKVVFEANGGAAVGVSIESLSRQDGTPLLGGETTIKAVLSVKGGSSGVETFTLSPAAADSIFDAAGNPMDIATQSSQMMLTRQVIYVKSGASGDNSGSTWANAYPELRDALNAAVSGDQIWVAAGTYKPTALADRSLAFHTLSGVTIIGGFAGTELSVSDRNWRTNRSILSGDIGTASVSTDNSTHVVDGSAGGILDGLVITNGYADGQSENDARGGALLALSAGSLILRNCEFSSNYALTQGGAVYLASSGATIEGCVFKSNSAGTEGGSLFLQSCSGGQISGSLFQSGTSARSGALALNFSTPDIINCIFTGNTATERAGAMTVSGYDLNVLNCAFHTNTSPLGRDLYCLNAGPLMANSIFWSSTPLTTGQLAVAFQGASVEFSNCDLQGSGGSSAWAAGLGTDLGGNLDIDPGLTSPADPDGADNIFPSADDGFRQTASSPMLDAGNSALAPSSDILGNPRPSGSGPDIGPYEGAVSLTPYVVSVTTSTPATALRTGEVLAVTINFNMAVTVSGTPALTLNTGQDGSKALYASGSGSSALVFNYTVAAGDGSEDLDYLDSASLSLQGGSISASGNAAVLTLPPSGSAASLAGSSSIVLDTLAPSNVANGLMAADNAWIRVTFSEGLYGDIDALTPIQPSDLQLVFAANGGTATDTTISGLATSNGTDLLGGESVIRVLLTITGTPSGAETIEIKAAGASTLFDRAGNAAPETLTTGAVNLNPSGAPRVLSLAFISSDDSYRVGDTISLTLTFDKSVNVTGSPGLLLATGTSNAAASYSTGSGTATLTFTYTVAATDDTNGAGLDQTGTEALELNSGTIVSSDAGLAAALVLPEPGAAGSLGKSGTIILDNRGPLLSSGTLAPYNAYAELTFSESVYRNSNGTGGLQPSDFNLLFTANGGTASGVTLLSLQTSTGASPSGGEKTLRALLSVLSRASGSETIEIKLSSSASVFDSAGNPAGLLPGGTTVETGTTGPIRLFPWTSGTPPAISGTIASRVIDRNIPLTLDMTQWESDAEDGSSGATSLKWTVSGADNCTVTGQNSDDDILVFTPTPGFTGSDTVTLTLTDSDSNTMDTDIDLVWIPHDSERLPALSYTSSISAWPGYPLSALGNGSSVYQQDFAAKVGTIADAWITLDLGEDKIISRVVVVNDGEYGAGAVTISAATQDSPSQFQNLARNGNLSGEAGVPTSNTLCVNPVRARYVRLLFSGFHVTGWFQLNEIEVWGDDAGTPSSRAISQAVSSPDAKPGREAGYLIDGQMSLNGDWAATHGGNPVDITLDLGETTEVWGFSLFNDGVYGAARVRLLGSTLETPATMKYQGAWDDLTSKSGEITENRRYTQPFEARYLVFRLSGFINDLTVGVNELLVYGQGAAGSGSEKLTISSITTSIEPYPGFGSSKLRDGLYFFNSDFAAWNKGAAMDIILDLGSDKSFSYLKIYNDGQYGATAVTISTAPHDSSGQPQTWTEAGSFTNLDVTAGTPRSNTLELSSAVTARWVKLHFTAFADSQWFQLNETEVWGATGQSTSTTGKVTISSIACSVATFPGYGVDTLFDGASSFNGDFACRNAGTETTLTLDFGSDKTFNSLTLVNDGEFGTTAISVTAATAAAPTTFQSLGSFSGLAAQSGSPTVNRLILPTTTARYLRITALAFADSIWFQLNEIEVLNGEAVSKVVASAISCDTTPIPGYGTDTLADGQKVFNDDFACRHGSTVTLYFDFGSDTRINKIVHVNDGQYGAASVTVKWATASAPSTWTTAGSFSNLSRNTGNPSEDSLPFPVVTARYIALTYTSFGDSTWFQLNEIEFYEDPGVEASALASSEMAFSEMAFSEQAEFNSDGAFLQPIVSAAKDRETTSETILMDSSAALETNPAKRILILENETFIPGKLPESALLNPERTAAALPDEVILLRETNKTGTPEKGSLEMMSLFRLADVVILQISKDSWIDDSAVDNSAGQADSGRTATELLMDFAAPGCNQYLTCSLMNLLDRQEQRNLDLENLLSQWAESPNSLPSIQEKTLAVSLLRQLIESSSNTYRPMEKEEIREAVLLMGLLISLERN